MMWDRVIEAAKAAIQADANLSAIFGDAVRRAAPSTTPFEPKVPILEYTIVTDTENELWAPTIIQFDVWSPDVDRLLAAERGLRRLFTPALPRRYGEVFMWTEFVDGAVLATPDRNGFHGRGLRFRFSPLRERYNPGLASAD
jgi:hypothetical protein